MIATLTLLGIACFGTTAAIADGDYEGVEFRRWSVLVSDLDRTIHLYRDILGLELGDISVDPDTSYVYEIFAIDPSITTRHATFHAGEKKRVLSVVEVRDQDLQKSPLTPRTSVALFNANGRFDAIVEQLRDEGFELMSPHRLGKEGVEIGFLDFDGHLYALYEYPYAGEDFAEMLTGPVPGPPE